MRPWGMFFLLLVAEITDITEKTDITEVMGGRGLWGDFIGGGHAKARPYRRV